MIRQWLARLWPGDAGDIDVELYRSTGPEFRSVRARVDARGFTLDTQDMGPTVEQVWGDSDYEFWTFVPRSAWGALLPALAREFLDRDPRARGHAAWTAVPARRQGRLLMALAQEFLAGDPRATDRLADICRRHGVAFEWGSWV